MIELIFNENKQVDISTDIINKLKVMDHVVDLDIADWVKYDAELGDIWDKKQGEYRVRVYTDSVNRIIVNDYFDNTYECNRSNIIELKDRVLFKIEQDKRICVMTKDKLVLYKQASEYDKQLELIELNGIGYNKIGLFSR